MAANIDRHIPGPQGPLFAACRQVHAVAVDVQPKGMLEVRDFAFQAPFSLGQIANAFAVIAAATRKQPVDPAFGQAVQAIANQVQQAAEAARRLGPAFDDLHPAEVSRLLNPRPREDMWDTTANGR